jgi:hypothetical protein
MAATPNLGQARQHFETIWLPLAAQYPEGSLIELTQKVPAGGMTAKGHRVPITDVDAFVEQVAKWPNGAVDCYVAVAPAPAEQLTKPGRTGKKAALSLPALVADVDVAGPGHAQLPGHPLPTDEQARELIDQILGQLPRLLIHTGGGFHVWVPLTLPLDHHTTDGRVALDAWKRLWVGRFAAAGVRIDSGPLADPARLLRVAGTYRVKPAEPEPRLVTIETAPQRRVALEEVLALAAVHTAPPRRRTRRASAMPIPEEQRRLPHEVPVGYFLEHVHGWSVINESTDSRQWATNDGRAHAAPVQAATYVDGDGIERVTVFSESTCVDLHIDNPTQHSLDSWAWVYTVYAGRDPVLTRRIATGLLTDLDNAVQTLTEHFGEDLHIYFTSSTSLAEVAATNGSAHPTKQRLYVAADAYARFDPPSLWIVHRTDEGEQENQVTNWLPITETAYIPTAIDAKGKPQPLTDALVSYDIAVVGEHGNWLARRVPADEADVPRKVLAHTTGAPYLLPPSPTMREHLANVTRATRSDMEVTHEWTSRGWAYAGGRWVFVAPGGPVTSTGPTPTCVVTGPPGSDAEGQNEHQRNFGWPEAPERLTATEFGAVTAFLSMLPKRPDVATALLGAIFAAPLGLQRRTTLCLHGRHGDGKTVLLRRVKAFFSMDNGDVFDLCVRTVSAARAAQALTLARDCPCFCDDYRQSEDGAQRNQIMTEVVELLSTAGYGAQGPERATAGGGLRTTAAGRTLPILTAELLPPGSSVLERMVVIALNTGDIPLQQPSPLDDWLDKFGTTGIARRVYGAYMRWLATQLDAHGEDGLIWLGAEAERLRLAEYHATGHDRAAEHVAVLAVGWAFLRRFAVSQRLGHLLPSEADIAELLTRVREHVRAEHTAGDTPNQLLWAIRQAIECGAAYLTDASGEGIPPSPSQWGWQPDGRGELRATGRPIGRVATDGQHALITDGGALYVAAGSRLRGLSPDQVRQAMTSLAGHSSDRAPRSLIPDRTRGWLLPFGLLWPETDVTGVVAAAITPPTPVTPPSPTSNGNSHVEAAADDGVLVL